MSAVVSLIAAMNIVMDRVCSGGGNLPIRWSSIIVDVKRPNSLPSPCGIACDVGNLLSQ